MNIDIYYKNLSALEKINPRLHYRLSNVKENVKYDVTVSNKDTLDVNIVEIATKKKIYQKPVEEITKQITDFEPFYRYPFLAFFGFGNGLFLKATLQRETHQKIIVIEPELEIVFIAMHFLDFSEDLASGRLKVFLTEDADYPTIREYIGLNQIGQFLKTYTLHINGSYYGKYQMEILKVNKTFTDSILHFIRSHGNDAIDSIVGLDHFWNNIPRMLKNPCFAELAQKQNTNVAIIVSTGPSLTKQLPLLKEIQESVTIISVDASMPILEKWGIKPDIVTSIERVQETAKFFEKTSAEFQKDIIFLSSALQHEKIYENIKDGQTVIAMRPFGYMNILGLDDYGYLGIGMSSANLAYELAFLMNYDHVVFIGQDLAYGNDGKSHAQNHVYGEDEVEQKDDDSFITAYGGHGVVRTTDIWRMFLGFFVSAIADSKDYTIAYNCTEGGARIDGTLEVGFDEAVRILVDREFKKERIVLTPSNDEKYSVLINHANKSLSELLKYAKKAKKRVEKLFLDVAMTCDELERLNRENKLEEVNFKKIKKLLGGIDETKEMLTEDTFRRLFWDIVQSYIMSQELDLASIAVKPSKTKEELDIKMVEFLFGHKPWLFMLAGGMEAVITTMEKHKKQIGEEAKRYKKFLPKEDKQEITTD